MDELVIDKKEELVMKLLHYFITEQGYNPIVLHGAKDEIWLENLDSDYKIVRIVSNYIHNMEQYDYDAYKAKQIIKQIKKKTLSLSVNTLSIYTDLGDNVQLESFDHMDSVYLNTEEDVKKYDILNKYFPTLEKNLNMKERGINLFAKITGDINKTNDKKVKQSEDIFKPKKPIITYILIALNVIIYIISILVGRNSFITLFGLEPHYVLAGQYYRIITSMFLHANITHLIFNMYSLYIIGSQVESFFNKTKYLMIYLLSGIFGALLSLIFTQSWSVGASGAIFGLLGAILYFGYHYRLYLGTVIKSQIIPVILVNLLIGFVSSGIDNAAHIGGLLGGIIASMIVGIKGKDTKSDRINGVIIGIIFTAFLIYLAFTYVH